MWIQSENPIMHIPAIRGYVNVFYAHLARTRRARAKKYMERFVSRDYFNFGA